MSMTLGRFVHLRMQGAAFGTPVYNDMGKSDPPPAPDYVGAANATAQGNQEAARVAAKANRVNQYTPYGSLVYSNPTGEPGATGYDPDRWAATIGLSPTGQQLLDSQNAISLGLGELGKTGLGYVQDTLNKPFDWSSVAKAPINAGTTAQEAIMSRLAPQIQKSRDALATQLANQGINLGSEAWGASQKQLGQNENDLLLQAALQGINLDTQARQQGIQEQSFARNEPLNMLNAVRSGAQVQNPQFVNPAPQATVSGPNLLGAAQAQGQAAANNWSAQQAQNQGLMSGLFSLGGSALMGGFSPWSLGGGALGGGMGGFSLPQF